jgi:hypothetical protein
MKKLIYRPVVFHAKTKPITPQQIAAGLKALKSIPIAAIPSSPAITPKVAAALKALQEFARRNRKKT